MDRNSTPFSPLKDKHCPVAADDLLPSTVQREMLLGKCLFLPWLISVGLKGHGREEDRDDQSWLIKEDALFLSPTLSVICMHGSDVKCLPVKRRKRTLFVCHTTPRPTFALAHECLEYSQSLMNRKDPFKGWMSLTGEEKCMLTTRYVPRQAENRKSTLATWCVCFSGGNKHKVAWSKIKLVVQ